MRFHTKVLTTSMVVETREFDASSHEEAQRVAEWSGNKLIHIREIKTNFLIRQPHSDFNLAVFNQQLYSLLEAGQPLVDSVDILSGNDKKGVQHIIYDTLLRHLRQGKQLSTAMSDLPSVFPALYIAMVRAGETTSGVRTAIHRFMHYQRQVDDVRRKLKSAALYPFILLAVGFIVVVFLLFHVVPRFSEVFDNMSTQRQASAGFVQMWGSFVRHNSILAWSALFTIISIIILTIGHPRTRQLAYRCLLTIPLVGEKLLLLQLARLYRTLGILLHSGVGVLHAIGMTASTLPPAMQSQLRDAAKLVSQGFAMSASMTQSGLTTEVAQRLLVAGESSGNLDEMMERIADFYDHEVANWIETAGKLIEPILMIGIGLLIGAVVLMLYMPVFDLADAV